MPPCKQAASTSKTNDTDVHTMQNLDIDNKGKFAKKLSVGSYSTQTKKAEPNDILQLLVILTWNFTVHE